MSVLYALESIRTPFLDKFFSILTYLGSEIVFMLLAITVYWCVSKSRGLYLLTVGYFGTVLNQFLKLICRVPRPWVRDPDFTIVESARAEATGYSFPSGHTQNAVGTFGALAMSDKRRWLQVVLWSLAALTAFSRMYLGVHTPWDVGVSAVLALALVFGLRPLFRDIEEHPKRFYGVLAVMILCGLAFILYASLRPVELENDRSGLTNAYKLLGAILGMTAGYALEIKWIHFDTKASFLGQTLKVVLGLLLVLAIKEGLKPVFGTSNFASALRYGLVVFFAAGIWPMTFGWFGKIGRKQGE